MNDFEKQFQDKLGQERSPLSGQEQDVLWDSIASQLDADASANDMRSRRRIAGCIAAVFVAAFVGFLYPVAESPTVPKENQKQAKVSDVSSPEALSAPLTKSADAAVESPAFDAKSGSNLDATANAPKKSIVYVPPAIVVNDRSTESMLPPSTAVLSVTPAELPGMDELFFMECQPPPKGHSWTVAERVPMNASFDEKNKENGAPCRSLNIRMYQGPTWSKFSYQEQGGAALSLPNARLSLPNASMKSGESWGGGGMIEFEALQQRWGVGVERNEFIHELRYSATFEEVNTIDNALLQVELDPSTGDTLSSVIGNAEVLVLLQRRVIHHNRLRTITIPMEWQKQWSFSPTFGLGVAFGALLHWRTLLSGRTFTDQEGTFMDYSGSEFPSRRISVAPMLRMHSAWDIAPDWSVQLSARISSMKYGSRSASELPDQSGQFKGRLLTGNLSLGVARAIW